MSNSTDPDLIFVGLGTIGTTFVRGLVVTLFTAPVVALLHYEALRDTKEYVLLCGLAAADLCNSLGVICWAIKGAVLFAMGYNRFSQTWSAIYCVLMPDKICFAVAYLWSPLMLLALSIDRLLLVTKKAEYLSWDAGYAVKMVKVMFGIGMLHVVAQSSYVISNYDARVSVWCFSNQFQDADYQWVMARLAALVSVLSCVVCAAFVCVYIKSRGRVAGTENTNEQKIRAEKQRKVTVTVLLSSCVTLVCDAMPRMVSTWSYYGDFSIFGISSQLIGHHSWILIAINQVANFFIYAWRHQEIKKGLKALMLCKEMGPNIDTWI